MQKMKGVISASVSLGLQMGRFKFDPEVTGPRDIIDELEVGFHLLLWILFERSNHGFFGIL